MGKYAKAALEKLGAWQTAELSFAMAENVRAALALAARGEAALGMASRRARLGLRMDNGKPFLTVFARQGLEGGAARQLQLGEFYGGYRPFAFVAFD
jgi:ABC-type molybdate transport system substrate-binding protein